MKGDTPLICLANNVQNRENIITKEREKIAKLVLELIQNGADVNYKNANGETASDIIAKAKNSELSKALLGIFKEYGAKKFDEKR